MPTDAIVLAHRRSRPRLRLGLAPSSARCSASHDPSHGPDQRLAAPRRSAMVGAWRPERAGGGSGHGRERLGPFSLGNVTAQTEDERLWPSWRTWVRGAEGP